jgi:hypothetical protein
MSPFKPSTPFPCPRDHLLISNKLSNLNLNLNHHHSNQRSNHHLRPLFPTKGASVSLLASTQLSAASPSLLGHYWSRSAGSLPSYNSGVVDWNGSGTWTRAERNTLILTGASNVAPGQGWVDKLARDRNNVSQRGTSTTFGVLGHQEDSHLDRLEKQHSQMPGPADNSKVDDSILYKKSSLNKKKDKCNK